MIIEEYIPEKHFAVFHEILCETDGRYLSRPVLCGNNVKVKYAPGDYREQAAAYLRATTPITETYSKRYRLWKVLKSCFTFKGR